MISLELNWSQKCGRLKRISQILMPQNHARAHTFTRAHTHTHTAPSTSMSSSSGVGGNGGSGTAGADPNAVESRLAAIEIKLDKILKHLDIA